MLFINIFCVAFIGLIIWWFWLYKPVVATSVDDNQAIVVKDGVYTPARVKVKAQQATTLTFLRHDQSGCSASLLIPDLEISQELALGSATLINLPPLAKGVYPFHCQMQMYKGALIVE
ncbi:cupredoxin domain-containing protein [Shewanella colwelliana]|uniref:cupredoxin domain-containing protein n=1 Tax=Shewanella colwelliana TaxID=23 RepID=UPI0022B04839|nr:cupredoxin domain-containing protein [Shewanella colwelliana]MCZ4338471.1 cupredoxin domain-containing protein [Shewanella colwelliana]